MHKYFLCIVSKTEVFSTYELKLCCQNIVFNFGFKTFYSYFKPVPGNKIDKILKRKCGIIFVVL